ncbi:helix-turn-helix transcriptional regulator [Chachezhania sediminis]|uniref:helix-turn-helix transcriptional regulator n=1 Tax=Chachezhania sediminis TaxID=2599291 RepID=UPI00131E0C86|nr:YafY family protein [Chachezhania sediminis]
MTKSNRLFETIQIFRSVDGPIRAEDLAARLEVSVRTVYRDIAALQAMRTPIEGEPGIGYVMRRGYDLPPLNFDEEEVEALRVGLCMLSRSGDRALCRAAERISAKIDALHAPADWLQVSPWGAPADDPELGCVSKAMLRAAVRDERVLRIDYMDGAGVRTTRDIRPIGVVYHINAVLLAAWCELRGGLRHFRTDRIYACEPTGACFAGQGEILRQIWSERNRWDLGARDLTGAEAAVETA